MSHLNEQRENLPEIDKLLEGEERPSINQVAWVFGCLYDSLNRGGCSFRKTIYGLMGYGPEAYVPLYLAGGMSITNAICESTIGGKKSNKEGEDE